MYPIDTTKSNTRPSGYSAVNPFWAVDDDYHDYGLSYTTSTSNISGITNLTANELKTYTIEFELHILYEDLSGTLHSTTYEVTTSYEVTNTSIMQNLDVLEPKLITIVTNTHNYIPVLTSTYLELTYNNGEFIIGNIHISINNVFGIKYEHIELLNVYIK